MLEGLVAWVLNNYLGKYVENLNTDQLSIALLSGEVELEQLPLRRDALKHLGLPLEVRAGFLGRVRLQVPVRQIRSAAWVIHVERLYVVAAPVSLDNWDSATERIVEHERKLAALDALEACWRAQTDNGAGYYASSYSSWLSYGTGVITDIVENLQLKIKDVHIRYEDGGNALACGLTVSSLSAQSCDDQWKPQFTHCRSGDGYSYKTIDLMSLALYWDDLLPGERLLSELDMCELAAAMDGPVSTGCHYIIRPVSGYAHVKRNRSEIPLRAISMPRLVCELHLDELPVSVADWQYEQLVCALRMLDFVAAVQKKREHRPQTTILEDPHSWWMYAVRSVQGTAWLGRWKRDWSAVLNMARENIQYVRTYEGMLAQPTAVPSSVERQLKEQVEWTRNLEQLRALREVAMYRVPRSIEPVVNNNGRSALAHWFPQWWYSTAPQQQTSETDTRQLEGELVEALSDAIRDNTLLRRDTVFGRFNFTLKRGAISLCTADVSHKDRHPNRGSSVPILELQFEDFQLSVESRPRTSTHSLELGLGSLLLRDLLTEDTLFPVLVGPPEFRGASTVKIVRPIMSAEHLFHLQYETCGGREKRLKVKSQPLDVVYQPAAVRWLLEFICGAKQRAAARDGLEAVKARTKQHLMKNWESILDGRGTTERTTHWDLQLDISAPHIIFAERFDQPNAVLGIVDLGRLHVSNASEESCDMVGEQMLHHDGISLDEDEMFVTPCSTPPGSETSEVTLGTALETLSLTDRQIRQKLYERYTLDLSDIQVLACRAREGWRYAHTRGSSSMHVLERFSITATCEWCLVRTTDPLYPAFTLAASLPHLVLHVNESKVAAIRTLLGTLSVQATNSPDSAPSNSAIISKHSNENFNLEDHSVSPDNSAASTTPDTHNCRLLMLQLTVEHVSLQVQSRGRSIAELQVTGASATFTRRPLDTGLTLTVHGLLLADALQTYGPDFELLVASHRHVAMDSVSGSLRDSEPTSPISPGSPDPSIPSTLRHRATSPVALSRALSGLSATPVTPDNEALIMVEYTAVEGVEPVRIANIQFNNLDIIANQETIVELLGFVRRVLPAGPITQTTSCNETTVAGLIPEETVSVRTELTFDFHRLNVLLMRGVCCDGGEVCGRKVATATMSEARIQATVEGKSTLSVRGELGGLQVLDLTPEGHLHRRILSVGMDPLAEIPHKHEYNFYNKPAQINMDDSSKAFEIELKKYKRINDELLDVKVRMASVWYTHAPQLLSELQSCAVEFRTYLSNAARSLRAVAADVALGLVHARSDGHSTHFSPGHACRRASTSETCRQRLSETHSVSYDDIDSVCGSEQNTIVLLNIDIVLNSPVMVLPRSPISTQVFVAHLGRISLSNLLKDMSLDNQVYDLEVRDMNLYSLETASRRSMRTGELPRAGQLYNCDTVAQPVLHDTILRLRISKEKQKCKDVSTMILDGDEEGLIEAFENLELNGSIVNKLKVSLTKAQYQQLKDTFNSLSSDTAPFRNNQKVLSKQSQIKYLGNIGEEEDVGVGTLGMDARLRARLFMAPRSASRPHREWRQLKLLFELPLFSVELRGENRAIELYLEQFSFSCERTIPHETHIQISLRSVHMDDLNEPKNSKLSTMVISTAWESSLPQLGPFVSHSCPDLHYMPPNCRRIDIPGSLPDHLAPEVVLGVNAPRKLNRPGPLPKICPEESLASDDSPWRPISDNLVLVSCLIVDPMLTTKENFTKMYRSLEKCIQIDFNCLNLVVRNESWALVFDFFGGQDDILIPDGEVESIEKKNELVQCKSELSFSVRSLTATLVKPSGNDIAQANISGIRIKQVTDPIRNLTETDGKLTSMSILDLTPYGTLYRERFQTSGDRALHFTYKTEGEQARLTVEMTKVIYVHTRRFTGELQHFFAAFGNRSSRKIKQGGKPNRKCLEVQAGAPLILLPVSSSCNELLVADLGCLTVKNVFETRNNCPLDIMSVELVDMDLYTASRVLKTNDIDPRGLNLSSVVIIRNGKSLLDDTCQLILTIERNLAPDRFESVPGLSIRGDLSTLRGALDLNQYQLIRGLLSYNIGEPIDDIPEADIQEIISDENQTRVTATLFQLGLQNVTVRLNENGGTPLGSIHFISSRLTVENFSDGAQDIDLLSREIKFMDIRLGQANIFTDILQPGDGNGDDKRTGMEVHSRKRHSNSEFTVLLNNMRLIAIPDWWQEMREYIFTGPDDKFRPEATRPNINLQPDEETPYEFKLNITDSEISFVQDTNRQDTTAVTLRSTTVLTWKPSSSRPLSCNLNHCELFSCVCGHEEETALSILEPVTVGVELNKFGVLEVQLQQTLSVRLSYHDLRMLAEMTTAVREQASRARSLRELPVSNELVARLVGLGFANADCAVALEHCEGQIEEAALWLTQNAVHEEQKRTIAIIALRASCLELTVIDDCGDADVPLAELRLVDLLVEHPLQGDLDSTISCSLSCDYYNRRLSGWEPCLEPWLCSLAWCMRRRTHINLTSDHLLDINITPALFELCRSVSDNWSTDMQRETVVRARRRFVPFALKNDTGAMLRFATNIYSQLDDELDEPTIEEEELGDFEWIEPGVTIPFEFGDTKTGKQRHGDTHRRKQHRLRIQACGWKQIASVSVDRVGIYFRDIGDREFSSLSEPTVRIVFDIQLEGSARKLVTVRSALLIVNRLPDAIEIRLGTTGEIRILSGETMPVPLNHSHQPLHVRPLGGLYAYCQPEIAWKEVRAANEGRREVRVCRSSGRDSLDYHVYADISCELSQTTNQLPAHTIHLLPALLLANLLPHDLHYTVRKVEGNSLAEGTVPSGVEVAVSSADASELELQFRLDGFRCFSGVRVPDAPVTAADLHCRLRLEDSVGRRLYLDAAAAARGSEAGLKVSLSAPYWLVNRTGLPLIFRQEGVATDSAGQASEHEYARMLSPLLFSWTDTDASPSLACRLGRGVASQPAWCQHFHLRRGVQVRRLRADLDVIYIIGIEVRPGKGRYRRTNIVTISPRHQLHNRMAVELYFSQAYEIEESIDGNSVLIAVPGCSMPFHWRKQNGERLLCVRAAGTLWSGGVEIERSRGLHLCLRAVTDGEPRFLRLEVVARGATLHVVLTAPAAALPPPLRVHNRSEVAVTFSQEGVACTCAAAAGACLPYAWDEPDRRPPVLLITAPGGATARCDTERLGHVAQLSYENFIYVAFVGTFKEERGAVGPTVQHLVLDVLDGDNGRVSLAVKQPGRRSQLWRMTSRGQLQHEGSPADRILVLDIEGPAPQPSRRDSRLALRRPDPRRQSTQTWRFTADGRLACAHENMCVQSGGGLWGLRPGGIAVLAVSAPTPVHRPPMEQHVGKQRMRPGSGLLNVEVTTDGPTRVLLVRDDIGERRRTAQENAGQIVTTIQEGHEIYLVFRLSEGLGISVMGRGPPQELAYIRLVNIVAEMSQSSCSRQLCLSVGDIQIDNQLFDTDAEVLIYSARSRDKGLANGSSNGPVLSISLELQISELGDITDQISKAYFGGDAHSDGEQVVIFRHLIVKTSPLHVHLEEACLLRIAELFGFGQRRNTPPELTMDEMSARDSAPDAASTRDTRYYFGVLSIAPGALRLSARTARQLPTRLRALRRRLGLTLIQFEDAALSLECYVRRHGCDTWSSLRAAVTAHFKDEILWQAGVILGNVDFLGGPLGLVNDVTEGVQGLINERSVGALVLNVTHGLSNSAAKVTDAIGDGLGRVLIMDEAHEQMRQRIRRAAVSGHLAAGFRGLGFGLLDGTVGLFRQMYEGAATDGVQGAVAGVGRGLVGLVAKPVVGVLDLAGEAARAVRDSSRGSSRQTPARIRPARLAVAGPGRLLPKYGSGREARGQAYLHEVNGGDRAERLVAYNHLCQRSTDDLRLIVGSERVRVMTRPSAGAIAVVTEVRLQDIVACRAISEPRIGTTELRHYVELAHGVGGAVRRPRIRCDGEDVARWAAQQVNFARRMLRERRYTLHAGEDADDATIPM